jgi:HSP20 family molecular chaperone IbpA
MSGLRDLAESTANTVLEQFGRGLGRLQERRPLSYDLLESEDEYLVVFDVPGATRSDLQVRFLDDAVQVRVDRFRDFHEGFEMRIPGRGLSLDGEAPLPPEAEVDPAGSSATLAEDGTLRVRLPKAERVTDVAVEDEPEEAGADGDEVHVADEDETTDAEDADADESDDAASADDGDPDADEDRD